MLQRVYYEGNGYYRVEDDTFGCPPHINASSPICAIIECYESRCLPVVPNMARYYWSRQQRMNLNQHTVEQAIEHELKGLFSHAFVSTGYSREWGIKHYPCVIRKYRQLLWAIGNKR